jgi:hypothetical protein
MTWILAVLTYLAIGNATGRFVAFDYNDDTETKKLPLLRRTLRRFVFTMRAWEWDTRYRADSEDLPILVVPGGTSKNGVYVGIHTFFWPFLRTIPASAEIVRLICSNLCALASRIVQAVLWPFSAGFSRIFPNKGQKLEYLQKFLEEISSNKARIEEAVSQCEAKLEHIAKALSEAEGIKDGEFGTKVTALILRLKELQVEQEKKIALSRDALTKVDEAEKKIADYNRLLVLYQKTADLADTNKEQDEIFEASLNVIKAVRLASMMLSEESTRAMIDAEVPYETIDASVREDVRRETESASTLDSQLLN